MRHVIGFSSSSVLPSVGSIVAHLFLHWCSLRILLLLFPCFNSVSVLVVDAPLQCMLHVTYLGSNLPKRTRKFGASERPRFDEVCIELTSKSSRFDAFALAISSILVKACCLYHLYESVRCKSSRGWASHGSFHHSWWKHYNLATSRNIGRLSRYVKMLELLEMPRFEQDLKHLARSYRHMRHIYIFTLSHCNSLVLFIHVWMIMVKHAKQV